MKKIQFKCTLLSDIVINQSTSTTTGSQRSLDFIPGSNFLGIVASQLYEELEPQEQLMLFHDGHVRFGDAHPAKQETHIRRALRVPASMYYPKLSSPSEKCYIHHKISHPEKLKDEQIKQCRAGFYVFNDKEGMAIDVERTFTMKSAYDRDKRRAKDECLFVYQAISEGLVYVFEVCCDQDVDDNLIKKIENALTGKRRVGRSRTAQYGLVEIEKIEHIVEIETMNNGAEICLYADGRLIFLDDYGLPTFTPTAAQLGFPNATILWEYSQIRTFQYAPWNAKRQSRDTDRCGIEKGSVFILKGNGETIDASEKFVGTYQNEGFGKIIINPAFLQEKKDSGGEAHIVLTNTIQRTELDSTIKLCGDPTFDYLTLQKAKEDLKRGIYKKVNEFIKSYSSLYMDENFASQWGSVRKIAMQNSGKEKLKEQLFDPKVGYLTHGVAKEKWEKGGRLDVFKTFFNSFLENEAQYALINLTAEMAKKCKNA